MNQITDTLRDSKRLRLIATALELMQYERTDSAVIPIPGTEPQRYVVVGSAETVARLLEIAPEAPANFCATCGKRLFPASIHTCTPPASTTASASDGSIYESVSRRANPEGHAEAMAQIDEVLARAPLPAQALDVARDAWQPISTAPQDELLLLAYEFDRPGDWRIKVGGYWNGGWEVFGASWTPTRWMRLPAAPAVSDYAARRATQSHTNATGGSKE